MNVKSEPWTSFYYTSDPNHSDQIYCTGLLFPYTTSKDREPQEREREREREYCNRWTLSATWKMEPVYLFSLSLLLHVCIVFFFHLDTSTCFIMQGMLSGGKVLLPFSTLSLPYNRTSGRWNLNLLFCLLTIIIMTALCLLCIFYLLQVIFDLIHTLPLIVGLNWLDYFKV